MRWGCLLLLAAVLAAISAGVRADEIRLKDGSKIVGTILGYDDGTFKVQTSYGFALVRKTSVAEIVPSESAAEKSSSGKSAPETDAAVHAAATPLPKSPEQPAAQPAAKPAAQPAAKPPASSAALPAADPSSISAKASPSPAASSAAPSSAIEAPKAAPVKEMVGYNLYTNLTYGFSMFKPPSWDLLPQARSALPEAITALGTSDGSTLLVIGRDTQGGTLDARAAETIRQLQQVYENYRPLSSRRETIAGIPAAEQRFRGAADGHDWSVIAVTLARGNEVFTILGMTYADSDLIQLQENIIAKSIGSLQFLSNP